MNHSIMARSDLMFILKFAGIAIGAIVLLFYGVKWMDKKYKQVDQENKNETIEDAEGGD